MKPKIGATKYIIKLAWFGSTVSLANNFKPSANGCNRPYIPVTLGPFLNCIEPNTLRSAKVT